MLSMWGGTSKKRKRNEADDEEHSNQEPEKQTNFNIYVNDNHIFFSEDMTTSSAFTLNKELRNLEVKLRKEAITNKREPCIYLHLTTNGGCITSAFSIIDCMESLCVPVHTVIDSNVSSAGTLVSIHGKKRYICKNSYILIHELRSGFWGKMTYLEENYKNCKKIQDHITGMYSKQTKMNKQKLNKILKQDLEFNALEAIQMGIADEIYKGG